MTRITDPFVTSVQAATESMRLAANDPSDAIRLLASLAAFTETATYKTSQATAAVMRRAALASLALACADYQPQSVADAQAQLSLVMPLFDAEIAIAANSTNNRSYQALRDLRSAVATDLQTRGGSLPDVLAVAGLKPARVIAYQQYGDATREAEVVARNQGAAFTGSMPLTVSVLSK